jgi:hypothetical protein
LGDEVPGVTDLREIIAPGRFHGLDGRGIRNERIKRTPSVATRAIIKRTASETDSPMASSTLAALALVLLSIRARTVVSLASIHLRG